jgi:C4-type Zn-finger protein
MGITMADLSNDNNVVEIALNRESELRARNRKLLSANMKLRARAEAAEGRITKLTDLLYNAEEFIQSVTRWDGQQDDQEELLTAIRDALKGKDAD